MAYHPQMLTRPVAVAETAVFMRQASALWTEGERFEFVDFIARKPRDRRFDPGKPWRSQSQVGSPGSGKRGGVRILYFYHDPAMPLYLLMIYAKARTSRLMRGERYRGLWRA